MFAREIRNSLRRITSIARNSGVNVCHVFDNIESKKCRNISLRTIVSIYFFSLVMNGQTSETLTNDRSEEPPSSDIYTTLSVGETSMSVK